MSEFTEGLRYKNSNKSTEIAFNVEFKGQGKDYKFYDQPCHGAIKGNTCVGSTLVNTMLYDVPNTDYLTIDSANIYLTWLIEESPYSHLIVEASLEEAKKKGYLSFNTDVAGNYLLSGLIASRYTRGKKHLVNRMLILKDAGLSLNDAFCVSHLLSYDCGDRVFSKNTRFDEEVSINPQHSNKELFLNFNLALPVNTQGLYSDGGNSDGVFGLWSGGKSNIVDDYGDSTEEWMSYTTDFYRDTFFYSLPNRYLTVEEIVSLFNVFMEKE